MSNRRRKRSGLASGFTKPLLGLALMGLLWGAYKTGLITLVAETIVSPLAPEGTTNAGELYERQTARTANEQFE